MSEAASLYSGTDWQCSTLNFVGTADRPFLPFKVLRAPPVPTIYGELVIRNKFSILKSVFCRCCANFLLLSRCRSARCRV